MASGWLSLTPRSRRRRATSPPSDQRSLSFSRGDRFMPASLDEIDQSESSHSRGIAGPPARAKRPRSCRRGGVLAASGAQKRGGLQTRSSGRCRPRLRTNLIALRTASPAPRRRGDDQRGADSDAAPSRPPGFASFSPMSPPAARFPRTPACRRAAAASDRQNRRAASLAHRGAAEHHDFAQQQRGVPPDRCRSGATAGPDRTGWFPAAARPDAPGRAFSAISICAAGPWRDRFFRPRPSSP